MQEPHFGALLHHFSPIPGKRSELEVRAGSRGYAHLFNAKRIVIEIYLYLIIYPFHILLNIPKSFSVPDFSV